MVQVQSPMLQAVTTTWAGCYSSEKRQHQLLSFIIMNHSDENWQVSNGNDRDEGFHLPQGTCHYSSHTPAEYCWNAVNVEWKHLVRWDSTRLNSKPKSRYFYQVEAAISTPPRLVSWQEQAISALLNLNENRWDLNEIFAQLNNNEGQLSFESPTDQDPSSTFTKKKLQLTMREKLDTRTRKLSMNFSLFPGAWRYYHSPSAPKQASSPLQLFSPTMPPITWARVTR